MSEWVDERGRKNCRLGMRRACQARQVGRQGDVIVEEELGRASQVVT